MITANHLRVGMTIDIEGELYEVEEFQHVKRGRGGAFVRTKLRGLQTLQSIRKVFQPEQRKMNSRDVPSAARLVKRLDYQHNLTSQ